MKVLSLPDDKGASATSATAGANGDQDSGGAPQTVNINSGNLSEFVGKLENSSKPRSPMETAIAEAIDDINNTSRREVEEKREESRRQIKDMTSHIDVSAHVKEDPLLLNAVGNESGALETSLTDAQKEAFVTALITNSRYTEKFTLFGGKISLTIRSRTLEETDSIEAYLRHQVSSGAISTASDYGNLTRKILLTAQVQEMNGIHYEELKGPMRLLETADGRKEPGWVSQLDIWGKQSSAIAMAVVKCLVEFETKYWFMVSHAPDANFWHRGESTAE